MEYQNYKEPHQINGKTIESCESIGAEFGRTYSTYLLLKFTDGTRQLIGGGFNAFSANPTIEEMRKAPKFFSEEDLIKKFGCDERKRRDRARERKSQAMAQYERLQRELGLEVN